MDAACKVLKCPRLEEIEFIGFWLLCGFYDDSGIQVKKSLCGLYDKCERCGVLIALPEGLVHVEHAEALRWLFYLVHHLE